LPSNIAAILLWYCCITCMHYIRMHAHYIKCKHKLYKLYSKTLQVHTIVILTRNHLKFLTSLTHIKYSTQQQAINWLQKLCYSILKIQANIWTSMYFAALLIALVSSPVVVSYNEFISYVYAAYFSLIRCKDKTLQLQVNIELCVLYASTCGTTTYVHSSMLYV